MDQFPHPFRRLTSSSRIRLVAVAQLLDVVCAYRCTAHSSRAIIQHVTNGRIAYAACCQELLDMIENEIKRLPAPKSRDKSGPQALSV